MRLLIIEDDGQLGPWLQPELANVMGGADPVTTLDEALAAIAVRRFDLIVVDRRPPDGDGVELLARLRQLQPRQSNAIGAHISRLRKRLRENGCSATIEPLRGLGYLLSDAR